MASWSWAIWLAIPLVVTSVVALATWLRARPSRELDTDEAMRAHVEYLEALTHAARSKDRGSLPRREG